MVLNYFEIKTLILLLVFSLTISSCDNRKQIKKFNTRKSERISINPKIDNSILASEIFQNIKLIPLETNSKSIIGEIDKIQFYDGNYFILDRRKQKAVFVFDSLGSFIQKIGNVGKGPGEYIDPVDFIIKNNEIEILARFLKKRIKYSLNGDLIKEDIIPFYATKFYQFENGDYIYYHYKPEHNNMDHHIIIASQNGDIINKYLPRNESFIYASDHMNFCSYRNQLYFSKCFNNNIFLIDNEMFTPIFSLDFQGHFIDEIKFDGITNSKEKIKILNSIPDVTGLRFYHLIEKQLIFIYIYNREYFINLFDVKTKTLKSFNKIKNDINGIPLDIFLPFEFFSKKIILEIPASTVINHFNDDYTSINNIGIKNLKDSDNSVLMILEFKDNLI